MFKTVLRFFKIIPSALPVEDTGLSKEEKAFNQYVDWLLSLDASELEIKIEYARRFRGNTHHEFLTKILAKKKKMASSPKVKNASSYEYNVGSSELSEHMVRFIVESDRESKISDNLKDITPSATEGKGGTFDGGGASGDWDRPTPSIINAAPRVYTTGTVDKDRRSDPEPEPETRRSGLASTNPVYGSNQPDNTPAPEYRSFSSKFKPSESHDPAPIYTPPSPSYGDDGGCSGGSDSGSCSFD